MSYMFSECSFESIDLSYLNTPVVENISHIFEGCSSLKEINFTNFNNEKVKDISYMFSRCSSITSIDLSILNNLSIRIMDHIFEGCSSLVSINLANFKTENVFDMSYLFSGCEHLESLNLSNFDTSNVNKMDNMFSQCSSLGYLDISNFNTSKVTNSYGMFDNVKPLKYINLYIAQIDNIKVAISGSIQETTTVCQKDTNTNNNEICCEDYNLETFSCNPHNYIKVKYNKNVTYSYGFSIFEYDKSENQYRPDIYLIKYNNTYKKPNETLIIKENTEIKIYLNSIYTTLAKFFYDYYDPKPKC